MLNSSSLQLSNYFEIFGFFLRFQNFSQPFLFTRVLWLFAIMFILTFLEKYPGKAASSRMRWGERQESLHQLAALTVASMIFFLFKNRNAVLKSRGNGLLWKKVFSLPLKMWLQIFILRLDWQTDWSVNSRRKCFVEFCLFSLTSIRFQSWRRC